jgi:pimeloyl-ACP methyl ester carboxylesterase
VKRPLGRPAPGSPWRHDGILLLLTTALGWHIRFRVPAARWCACPGRNPAYLGDLGGVGKLAGRELVFLELRGTGASAVPADPATYRCDRMTGDVEALRAHLGLDQMDLLGHSAGGDLAQFAAALVGFLGSS